MSVRSLTSLAYQVGEDNSLAAGSLIGDIAVDETVDTLDKAVSRNGDLAGAEVNVTIDKGDISTIRVVAIEADGPLNVFFGGAAATAASHTGVGGAYPTGLVGAETLDLEIDSTAFTTTFLVADQALADVVKRINAAAAFEGIDGLIASESGGQLKLTSKTTGVTSQVKVVGGTAAVLTALGLVADTEVLGVDPTPGASAIQLRQTAEAASSQIENLKAYALLSIETTSVILSNPEAATAVRYKVIMVGDLVAADDC